MKEPKVAIYIRLSLADEDTGDSKSESNSVQHQRMLIKEYLDRHEELKDAPRTEFVDDGYTGTNTDRPGFQAAMKALRSGEANVLVTKDFSRAMRDYTEMGNYLECVFPFLGVRYISINDGYDSNDYKGVTGGMEVVLRNIVYASYSKDLSVKTTTAKLQMMKQGKYIGSFAPYGYRFHPDIRNKLAADPESAEVVRRIFDLALEGKKTGEIAHILNMDRVLTPGSYFRMKHPGSNRFQKKHEDSGWTSYAVLAILRQYEYTGATVGHKRSKAGLSIKKTMPNDRADWIVVEGMHEAIVSKEEFERVQGMLGSRSFGKRMECFYPLKGVARCGECRKALTRRKGKRSKAYFTCDNSRADPNARCPRCRHYLEEDLERVVLNAIQQMLSLYQRGAGGKKGMELTRKGQIASCAAELSRLQQLQERYRQEKLRAYESYIAEIFTREKYLGEKARLDAALGELELRMREGQKTLAELEEMGKQKSGGEEPPGILNKFYGNGDQLTNEMVGAFVKDLYLFSDSRVEIVWKFQDVFERLLKEEFGCSSGRKETDRDGDLFPS